MKALGQFLSFLLALALAVTATVFVINATIWNATYMQGQLGKASVAQAIADVLPELAAKVAGNADQTKTAISSAVTPQYVHDQMSALVPQVLEYYQGTGAQPLLDLRDLQARVTAEGLTLPENVSQFINTPQPVKLGGFDATLMNLGGWLKLLSWLAPLAAAVLAVVIIMISRGGRWLNLAVGAISGAGLTLLAALISYGPSPLIGSALNTSNVNLLAPAVRDVTDAIAKDQIQMFLTWSKGYAIAAGVLLVLHIITRLFHRPHKHKKHGKGGTTPVDPTNGMPTYN